MSCDVVLALDSVSVSSTLATGTPLLVVTVVLDQTSLFISDKQKQLLQLKNGKYSLINR